MHKRGSQAARDDRAPAQPLAVRPLGLARPAALLEDQPQVIVRRGVLGLELRGPPRRRFGLAQPVEIQEHGGEVDVRRAWSGSAAMARRKVPTASSGRASKARTLPRSLRTSAASGRTRSAS